MTDLSIYLVTDPCLCAGRGVVATVREAVDAGVTAVQLRDPGAARDELVRTGRALREVLAGTGVPLIVNDRVDLVDAIGADGAHVGQGDTDPSTARRLIGPGRILGLSVQTLEHLDAALELPASTLDYLGVGPVWPQTTKPDAAAPGGPAVLTAICDASPWPCVAIGGIDATRVATAKACGAAGVAVVSAVCGQPDVGAAVQALRAAWAA